MNFVLEKGKKMKMSGWVAFQSKSKTIFWRDLKRVLESLCIKIKVKYKYKSNSHIFFMRRNIHELIKFFILDSFK